MRTTTTFSKRAKRVPKPSEPLSLDVFEGLGKWGEVRLRPHHLDNLIHVELRRVGESMWKPILTFVVVGDRIAYRTYPERMADAATIGKQNFPT